MRSSDSFNYINDVYGGYFKYFLIVIQKLLLAFLYYKALENSSSFISIVYLSCGFVVMSLWYLMFSRFEVKEEE